MLAFNRNNIIEYAERYDKRYRGTSDESVEREIKELLKNRKYLSRKEFIKIGLWKSKRPKKHYVQNDDLTTREITQFSFNTKSERARIKSLFVLNGVSYPLASVILHFAFPDKYPILDVRTLWSLGWQARNYNFDFWQKYCDKIREVSEKLDLPIRTIDKALWEYSKENQKASG